MIVCFIGTRAQVIKMAPILHTMERRGLEYRLVLTGQHEETIDQLLAEFNIATPPVRLHGGKEISGILQMGVWFMRCLWTCLSQPRAIWGPLRGKHNVLLVHGDTVSTLLGALIGKLSGFRVAHIEAGLRSRNLLHPFPEEITRMAVFHLSDLSFCPGKWACENLEAYGTKSIDTQHNTLIDALAMALDKRPAVSSQPPPSGPYGIASIHRFENIFTATRLTRIIELIEKAAERHRLIFVLHPSTRKKLGEFGLLQRIDGNPKITVVARMGYVAFVHLMKDALFVISDGGGNQEELSYLGVPTLLMRKATERQEGLSQTATLCHYEESKLIAFLDKLTAAHTRFNPPDISPTSIIMAHIEPYASVTE